MDPVGAYTREHLSNRDLYCGSLVHLSCERGSAAHFIADLAEIDRRRMYLQAGYPSMYAFCVGQYKLSEDAAWKRIQVARIARRFPAMFEALAGGRLHLSGAVLLSPHLTDGNSEDLLAAAAGRTKSQIVEIIARRFPRSELLPMVEAVPRPESKFQPAPGQVFADTAEQERSRGELEPDSPSSDVLVPVAQEVDGRGLIGPAPDSLQAAAHHPVAPVLRSRVEPIAPERYALHLSIGRGTHEKLVHAQELLSHSVPSGDLAEVLDRALDLLVTRLEKQKFAATSNPRPAREPARSPRAIPAEVRRAVWRRDEGRCTFVGAGGRRCESRRFLEFHHVEPVAHGGPATVENVFLRCRAHNQHEAEQLMGAGFMEAKRADTEASAPDAGAQDSADATAF